MSDISKLTTRINSALARIEQGVAAGRSVPQTSEAEDRLRQLQERQEGKLAELTSTVEAARARAARMDRELQRLREVNAALRDVNSQLREAVAQGVADPDLINGAMQAELDALRANRAADVAEMDAILDDLKPIIEQETPNAPD